MKRLISLVLVSVLVLSNLTSCSLPNFSFGNQEVSGDGESESVQNDTLSVGQWLIMINNAFGMQSYIEDKPYFENIPAQSPYFETVQIATEWGLIDINDEIDVEKELLWETALVTLVNAGNFVVENENDADKIRFAINNFDKSINETWMDQPIEYQKAIVLLTRAQEMWANKSYDETVEKIVYNDNVINLADTVKTDYYVQGNQVTILAEMASEINEGDVYILRSQENPLEYSYYRATQISTNNGVTYISNTEEKLELEDVVQEVKLQGTIVPTADNTIIYDGNGNVIGHPQAVSQRTNNGDGEIKQLSYMQKTPSMEYTFEVDDNEISLSYNLNGALDMKIGVKNKKKLESENELEKEASFEVSKLVATHDFDFNIWEGLKSAEFKLDYEVKSSFEVKYSTKPLDGIFAPEYSNGNGKFLTNFKRAILKDKDGDGAHTIASKKVIDICSLNIYNAGVAKIALDVKLVVAVDGSLSVTVTQGGITGIEYKKGNLRFIKENSQSAEAEVKAQAEITLGFGPALYLIGLKEKLLALEVEGGVGAEGSVKMHLADDEMHLIEELSFNDTPAEDCEIFNTLWIEASAEAIQVVVAAQGCVYKAEAGAKVRLHVDTCFDVSVYGILTFGLSDDAYAARFIDAKVKLTCTVLDSKNAKFFNYHVDNGNWVGGVKSWGSVANLSPCDLEYVPFEKEQGVTQDTEATEATNSVESIHFGEFIVLSSFRGEVGVGGKYCINITQMPTGYSLSDIVYEIEDKSIATINEQGVIEGVKAGNTIVVVKTSDGKHVAVMSIAVVENSKIDFEGIKA